MTLSKRLLLAATLLMLSSPALPAGAEPGQAPQPIQYEQLIPSTIQNQSNAIYIIEGEAIVRLSNKNREQFVVLPWLQVHGRQATLLVQCDKKAARVSVLSGKVIIKNTLERHIVEVASGFSYDGTIKEPHPTVTAPFSDCRDHSWALPMFETKTCRTVLYKIDAEKLTTNLKSAEHPTLIQLQKALATCASRQIRIISPPTALPYRVGDALATVAPVSPDLTANFPPSGIITADSDSSLMAGSGSIK